RLLAEALRAPLADAPGAPLHLVNIAGGPALDSINALILLARADATLLHRPIAIHVFDAQQDGPTFGARALLALAAPEGPLNRLGYELERGAQADDRAGEEIPAVSARPGGLRAARRARRLCDRREPPRHRQRAGAAAAVGHGAAVALTSKLESAHFPGRSMPPE